jgi:hypothetical protein
VERDQTQGGQREHDEQDLGGEANEGHGFFLLELSG